MKKSTIAIFMICCSLIILAGGADSSTRPRGHWSFDKDGGDIAHDYSGNNNHGTIHGAIWASNTSDFGFVIEQFPTRVGNGWKYKENWRMIITDSVNDTSWTEVFIDSFYCRFGDIDTLQGWETYRYDLGPFTGDSFPEMRWFAHPDTALLWIAYSGIYCGAPPWKNGEKVSFVFNGQYFASSRELQCYILQVKRGQLLDTQKTDTTFWTPPKKVLVFPLSVGTKWISMEDPWLEEREVIVEEIVEVPAGSFPTLKIEFRPEWLDFRIFHWIAEEGIIKDSLYWEGLVVDELGDTIGWAESYDVFTLIDYHGAVTEYSWTHLPEHFHLSQNFPNPFNPITEIKYALPKDCKVRLEVYNILGQRVAGLVDGKQKAGYKTARWDATSFSSGIYFYRLQAGDFVQTRKMVLLK